jgi:hypothetical protein
MSLISNDEIKALLKRPKDLCVSIFMPTHQAGAEIQQNPIRFKNLMREAEESLVAAGIEAQAARELLQPAQALDTSDFWQHQSDGLAIFLAPEVFRYYRLPLNFEELVVVTDRFHLKPLLPLLTGDGQFYVLALSQNQVRLFEGTRYSVNEVELKNVPQSLAEALRYDEPGKQIQFRISTSKGGTSNSFQQAGSFHGQGSPETDDITETLLQYFHEIDRGLHELLRDAQAPLIVAGVEYLLPIYREANSYRHLLEEGLTGNPEELSPEELHDQAWAIVEPYFLKAQQEAAERYQELAATGQTSTNLQEIVSAAYYSRVETLFVPVGVQQWGIFNSGTNDIQLHEGEEPGDEDLLDFAAVHTFLNGGNVYAVEPEKVPDNALLAAVFRY